MRRAFVVGVAAAAVIAAGGSRAGGRRGAGRLVRLAVGQSAAAGQHREARSRSRGSPATRSVSSARSCAPIDGGSSWTGRELRHVHEPHRGPGDRRDVGVRRRRLRRPALGRRRRHGRARRIHAGRVELQRAARRRVVGHARRPATSCSPTGPRCAPTTTATRSRRRSPCPARGRPAAARRSTTSASPTRTPASRRRTTARSTAPPTAPTPGSRSSRTTRAVHKFLFIDANNGVAVGDQSLFLATTTGGLTWSAQGPDASGAAEPHGRLLRRRVDLRHGDRHDASSCAPATAAPPARS